MASGMVDLKHPGSITPGGFNEDELKIIVAEAAKQGLAVMAHANGEQAIMAAARAGVRSIEHGFFMTDQALDLMAERGIFWVPTIGALRRAAESSSAAADARKFAESLIHAHLTMLGHAYSIGVPLAVGTDCVLPDPAYRSAYDAEIELFGQAGIAHDVVLTIASAGGAKLLGI
jgi:imidazolonepropionase-like amidohydrolase